MIIFMSMFTMTFPCNPASAPQFLTVQNQPLSPNSRAGWITLIALGEKWASQA